MRKNKFILNLIAATAIGLSVFGCESSSSGSFADATDISSVNSENIALERLGLREYFIIGQRGQVTFSPVFGAGQSAPADAPGEVIAGSGDDSGSNRALLYEIVGIADTPLPNGNLLPPGGEAEPSEPEVDTQNEGTTGYQSVYINPNATYCIGMSRARGRGGIDDPDTSINNAQLQIFSLETEEPLDEVFPPVMVFGNVADGAPIRVFQADQGKFVSGGWSATGLQFYASVDQSLITFSVSPTGGLQALQTLPFPAGAGGINNAVEILSTADGKYVFAIDNANNQLLSYSRNLSDGTLTGPVAIPTVTDPRGASIDRSGNFLYVAGRSSNTLAGYRIEADGNLTQIEVFSGFGPIGVDLAAPLGDVACNPQTDNLYVGTYLGVLQAYSIDPATGRLSFVGNPGSLFFPSRNMTNIEVEPTGRFVLTAQEADLEEFQSFVTVANGFPNNAVENPIYAELDSTLNGAGQAVYSATGPQQDSNNRTVEALLGAVSDTFTGDVQIFRIQPDGSVYFRPDGSVEAENPYGLEFFQKVFPVPAGSDTPTDGGTDTDGTGT